MSRLIDADNLIDLLYDNEYKLRDGFGSNDYGMFTDGFIEMIKNAPTIETDRPKGKWELQEGSDMVEDGFVCGSCGRYIHDFLPLKPDICTPKFEKELVSGFNFCPNCGADMREEAE